MTVLALDLGTACGWAVSSEGQLHSGVWRLVPSKKDRWATRGTLFVGRLQTVFETWGIDTIVYEQVERHDRTAMVRCRRCNGMTPTRKTNTDAM